MKDNILKLRSLGMSYNQIANRLKCSKSLINYYCSSTGKEKTLIRSRKNNFLKKKSKNKLLEYHREFLWRHKRRYGCVNCGNKDPRVLEYDHINPELKIKKISILLNRGNSIKILKNEIRKCQILCANCHRIKTINQLNWWTFE